MFSKEIPEGGQIPKGYGVSWRYFGNLNVRCYPIPFNLIMRGCYHFWGKVKRGWFPSKYEGDLLTAYMAGISEEYNRMLKQKGKIK